jgi:hypothetical protein
VLIYVVVNLGEAEFGTWHGLEDLPVSEHVLHGFDGELLLDLQEMVSIGLVW